ncbi:MAG: VWA domain-containing protein, partial [Calditrichae bacterium]|nr:VWA domain-containing protein [Calditrichia bacterium]
GSMAGVKLEQAKKAITFCVENLNQGDRFEIVRFSTQAEALFEKLVPFKSATKKQATKFIKNLKAIGGTNIEGALELALTPQNQSARPHFVVFITDGKPTIGETDEQKLLEKIQTVNQENLRIFTFGIGDEINTHLLDKITEQTRAYRTYVHPEEDIEVEISNFYTKVSSPILTNLELSFSS